MAPRRRKQWSQLELSATPSNDVRPEVANDQADDGGLYAFVEGEEREAGEVTSPPAVPAGPSSAPTTEHDNRVRGGRRAKRRGEALETWLRALLSAALTGHVLAHWMQIWPEAVHKRVPDGRGGWHFTLSWGERAHADFAGTTVDGRSIAIECKTVEGARLARTRIKPQQLAHLDAVAKAGGVALLVVGFRDEGMVTSVERQYAIPWHLVPWVKVRTALSIDEASVAQWRVRHGLHLFELLKGRR